MLEANAPYFVFQCELLEYGKRLRHFDAEQDIQAGPEAKTAPRGCVCSSVDVVCRKRPVLTCILLGIRKLTAPGDNLEWVSIVEITWIED